MPEFKVNDRIENTDSYKLKIKGTIRLIENGRMYVHWDGRTGNDVYDIDEPVVRNFRKLEE